MTNKYGRLSFFAGLLLNLLVQTSTAQRVETIVFGPSESENNSDGNSEFIPFDIGSARYQQVFAASIFDPLTTAGGGWIYEIDFRIDATLGHSFIATVQNLQLNLSTTSSTTDQLSLIFDENVGSDNSIALGPGAVRLAGSGGGGFTGFHISFLLEAPFLYNPANGNLLMDFKIHEGIQPEVPVPGGVAILDAFDVVGDSVSSVYAFGNTMPISGQVSSLGLATAIRVIPVPEPSTWAILVIACVVALVGWRRTSTRKEGRHG